MMTAPTGNPMGRPTEFTDELAALICERLSTEEGGLFEVCKAEDMPARSTVYQWLGKHSHFADMYARAREDLGTYVAHQGVKEAVTTKDHQLGRLQFDARKWLASKLAQKQFGDKTAIVGGSPENGDQPIRGVIDVTGMSAATLAELAQLKVQGE